MGATGKLKVVCHFCSIKHVNKTSKLIVLEQQDAFQPYQFYVQNLSALI